MKNLILSIALVVTGSLYSQDYHYQTVIEQNTNKGFYKVELSPEILGKLNANFSDLRLMDNEHTEQSYYIEKEVFSVDKRVFKPYKIKEQLKWKNGATVLFVENTAQSTINNIQLQIKNFDVRKHLELAGSNDYNEWFTIKENYVFRSANGGKVTSEVKSLNFPYCDYKYYRIIIYDVFSLPINVMKVGYYDTYQEQGKFNEVNELKANVIDTSGVKQTFIHLQFKDKPYFDKLVFEVEKPTYFYRNAKLALKQKDYKGRVYYNTIYRFVLNSNSDLTFYTNSFKYDNVYLIIDNEDNPPLEIKSIKAFQLKHYLVAHLEAKNKYKLVFGNDKQRTAPNYDIAHFKTKVGADTPYLKTKNISLVKTEAVSKTEEQESNYLIWLAVAGVALLLGFVSYKMIIEMEKK